MIPRAIDPRDHILDKPSIGATESTKIGLAAHGNHDASNGRVENAYDATNCKTRGNG
jgi:hypothetical protein